MKNLSQHIIESFSVNESKGKDVTSKYLGAELDLLKMIYNASSIHGQYRGILYISKELKSVKVNMVDMVKDWKIDDAIKLNSKLQSMARKLQYKIEVDKTNNFGDGVYGDTYDANDEKVYESK